jgi:hypothetical protein
LRYGKNKPYSFSDYLYPFGYSILSYEVFLQAVPEWSRSPETLPHQADKRQGASMERDPWQYCPEYKMILID